MSNNGLYTFPGCETGSVFSLNQTCNTSLTATLPDLSITPAAFRYEILSKPQKDMWLRSVKPKVNLDAQNWQPPTFENQQKRYKFSAVGIL